MLLQRKEECTTESQQIPPHLNHPSADFLEYVILINRTQRYQQEKCQILIESLFLFHYGKQFHSPAKDIVVCLAFISNMAKEQPRCTVSVCVGVCVCVCRGGDYMAWSSQDSQYGFGHTSARSYRLNQDTGPRLADKKKKSWKEQNFVPSASWTWWQVIKEQWGGEQKLHKAWGGERTKTTVS